MKAILKLGVREIDLVTEYTGHPYDPVLSVYYARARMYDAADRRFMAMDPYWNADNRICGEKTFTFLPDTHALMQSANLYIYSINNPIKMTDPTGAAAVSDQRSVYIPWTGDNRFALVEHTRVLSAYLAELKLNTANPEYFWKMACVLRVEFIGLTDASGKKGGSGNKSGTTVVTPPTPGTDLRSHVLYDQNAFWWSIEPYASSLAVILRGIYNRPVTVTRTSNWTPDTFIQWWNSLPEKVDAVAILGHANAEVIRLDYSKGSNAPSDAFRIGHIAQLNERDINMLLLMGCNTGHIDKRPNMASAFLEKVGTDGTVIASDGSLAWWPAPFRLHSFKGGESFQFYLPDGSTRTPLGFVAYSTSFDSLGNKETVLRFLDTDASKLQGQEAVIKLIYDTFVRTN